MEEFSLNKEKTDNCKFQLPLKFYSDKELAAKCVYNISFMIS